MATTKRNQKLLDWAALLATALTKLEPVPDGWVTVKDLAVSEKRSIGVVCSRVRKLKSDGKVEARKFMVKTGRGVFPVWHYRIKG